MNTWSPSSKRLPTLGLLACSVSLGAAVLVACGPTKTMEVANPNSETSPTTDPVAYGEGPPMPDPAPASSGPVVHESGPKSHDVYDKEATDVVLARAARQVKANCGESVGEDGKATGPWGKLTIQVLLGHNGHTKSVTVPPPYADTPAGRCVVLAFQGEKYPPWNGQDTQVDWEVELVKPAGAGGKPKK